MNREPVLNGVPDPVYRTRREFLARTGSGFGLLALAGLLGQDESRACSPPNPLATRPSHFPARARSVIWLFMNGGPSHVDTWDHKPELTKRSGQTLRGFNDETGFFSKKVGPLMKSPFTFKRYGQSGAWVSEIFPNIAQRVDDLAFIHSCHTDSNSHSPALFQINTGMNRMGFPCLGSWTMYGLGTENQDLPGFVVMTDTLGRGLPKGHALNWGAGFLPSVYQGTALNTQGAPIDNLARSGKKNDRQQRAQLDLLSRLNRRHLRNADDDPDLAARIESFELAYRMQMSAPEILDVSREPRSIRKLYGLDNPTCGHFGKQCLMARKMVERGVRFIQIYSGGVENAKSWDGHNDIVKNHGGFAAETDRPIGALLGDLKARGLLESTLVIWCGEFGRLPLMQQGGTGRDHNPRAFTTWMAGGGIKGGTRYGETDEIGLAAEVDPVTIHDLHATILHLLGIDHLRLTYRFSGRDFRLTDVYGNVIRKILA